LLVVGVRSARVVRGSQAVSESSVPRGATVGAPMFRRRSPSVRELACPPAAVSMTTHSEPRNAPCRSSFGRRRRRHSRDRLKSLRCAHQSDSVAPALDRGFETRASRKDLTSRVPHGFGRKSIGTRVPARRRVPPHCSIAPSTPHSDSARRTPWFSCLPKSRSISHRLVPLLRETQVLLPSE
jgi:hypothetical protein